MQYARHFHLSPEVTPAAVPNEGQPVIFSTRDIPDEGTLGNFQVKGYPSLSVLLMADRWALLNMANDGVGVTINLPVGTFIAGFGRGGFRNLPGDRDPAENGNYLYELKDSNDAILYNNHYTTIGAIHMQEAQRQPDIGVAYHEMRETGLVDRKFDLVLTEKVVFVPRRSSGASGSQTGPGEGADPENPGEAITSCWGNCNLPTSESLNFRICIQNLRLHC